MAVELAVTPDERWRCATADLAAAASAAGFAGLAIGADKVDDVAVAAYSTARLRCHEVLAFLPREDPKATMASAEQLADAAQRIGADWVLTAFPAAVSAEMQRVLRRCAAIFAAAGAGMAVEFSPLGPVSSIQKGMEAVRATNRGGGRAGKMVNTWHFFFSDSMLADLATVPLDDIAYVQFADALPAESDNLYRETTNRRGLPGEGTLDLDRFASTLLDRGWDGTVSVEVLSADLRTLPADTLMRRLYHSAVPYWR